MVIIWRWGMGYKASVYTVFRMMIQLLLSGCVLTYIFGTHSNYIVITVLIIMLLATSWISLRTTSLPKNNFNILKACSNCVNVRIAHLSQGLR